MTEEMELPKQWKRWIKKAGLRCSSSINIQRDHKLIHYFKGYGRHWQLNCNNELDVSEKFDTFDKWSNSRLACIPMTATNEKEFVELVQKLFKDALEEEYYRSIHKDHDHY